MNDVQAANDAAPAKYHVRLKGPRPGVDAGALSLRLAAMFKCTPEQMLGVLESTDGVIVKRGVDKPTAQRYMLALVKAGAACSLEAEASAAPAPSAASTPAPESATPAPAPAAPATANVALDKAAPASERLSEEALQRLLKSYHSAPVTPAGSAAAAVDDNTPVEYDKTDSQLAQMALGQKLVIDAVLLNALVVGLRNTLPSSLLLLCSIAVGALCIVALLRMAAGLYLSPPAKTLAVLAMAVPLVNVVVLLVVNTKANRSFKEEGYTVGFFGVPADEREMLAGAPAGGMFADHKLSLATLALILACVGFGPQYGRAAAARAAVDRPVAPMPVQRDADLDPRSVRVPVQA
ncbi:MAG: hypothetical protein V4857_04775 [Pseudomonadota bacterium]